MGRPKEERRSTGIDLGSLLNKKSEPKEALLFHQSFCVSSRLSNLTSIDGRAETKHFLQGPHR